MSRKSNDTPSSIRIRENQRRSRIRRAEHLHSLEKRVQEYERQGVAATLEMQRAARKVAQDNVRLRALLLLHGVSNDEIESSLRSSDETSTSKANLSSFRGLSTTLQHQPPVKEGNDSRSTTSPKQTQSQHMGHERTRIDSRLVLDTAENHSAQHLEAYRSSASIVQTEMPLLETVAERDDTQDYRESYDSDVPCPVIEHSDCPTSLDCFCAPPPSSEIPPISSEPGISCETAAIIIAEMRGDGDRDLIRASLGCRGQAICTIQNSVVFQIMDKE